LIINTLIYGAVGTAVTTAWLGLDVSGPYALGSGAGALYIYLLGKNTDKIGAGIHQLQSMTYQVEWRI